MSKLYETKHLYYKIIPLIFINSVFFNNSKKTTLTSKKQNHKINKLLGKIKTESYYRLYKTARNILRLSFEQNNLVTNHTFLCVSYLQMHFFYLHIECLYMVIHTCSRTYIADCNIQCSCCQQIHYIPIYKQTHTWLKGKAFALLLTDYLKFTISLQFYLLLLIDLTML